MGWCCCAPNLVRIFSRRSHDNEMTEEEIVAIRECWFKAKNHEIGKKILTTLIERRPKFAEYFGIVLSADEGLDFKVIHKSREFQLQAHRIQSFLDTAVGSLGYCPISSVYDMAARIGQIHFYRGVNFEASNWLVFKKVAVDQVTSLRPTSKSGSSADLMTKQASTEIDDLNLYAGENCLARLGWNKLMTVIVREMKRGFLAEAMRNCKEEDTLAL
uniref:GLOBIN domain-containing protein n=1 Tax=Panagrellus redivivus TaxID=6233 RepID=A0A7E4W9M5_PANRE